MPPDTQFTLDELLATLRRVHRQVRAVVLEACGQHSLEELCGEASHAAGDVVYAIDRVAESALLSGITEEIATHVPIVLIGEGVPQGRVTLPQGVPESQAAWRIIIDPIDGTRGFMFQKRSGWIVTGVAPNLGETTMLSDIVLAVQTELPLLKQHLCDEFWAMREQGARGERFDRIAGTAEPLAIRPSQSPQVAHGFGTVCSFFAGGRDLVGRIADELSRRLLCGHQMGEARIFEDQYPASAGQLVGLLLGQDRYVIDLRPLLAKVLQQRCETMPHCCHPYDIAARLIAEEAGVILRTPMGEVLDAPLDTETDVAWAGYANEQLWQQIGPVAKELVERILLS
jgi:hypothetical protein